MRQRQWMSTLGGAVVLCSQISCADASQKDVRIEVVDSAVVLRLSPPMQSSLRAFDLSFRPWRLDEYEHWLLSKAAITPREAPPAVFGDFNADGSVDLAVDGRTTTHAVLLVVLSDQKGYRTVELERSVLPADGRIPGHFAGPAGRREIYLTPIAPRTVEPPVWDPNDPIAQFVADPLNPKLILTTDAFAVNLEEKGGTLYFHRNDKFWRLRSW